ncbi:MAG: DUF11 domain-containing protein, partial [Dolichospermum sp.]
LSCGGTPCNTPVITGRLISDTITTICCVDMGISKTVSPSPIIQGNNAVFTIAVVNNGSGAATNVVVNDVLPAGVTYVSHTTTSGTWAAPNWTIPSMVNGQRDTIRITVTGNTVGNNVNTAFISSISGSPITNVANDTSRATLVVTSTCSGFSAGADQTACGGEVKTLTGINPTTGTWSADATNPAGATVSSTTAGVATAAFTTAANGTFRFIYVAGTCRDTMNIVVTAKPNAGADQNGICAGSSATLTGTPNTGTWSAMAGNPAGATLGATAAGVATVSFTTTTSGAFNFIYIAGGCADTMTVNVTAKPNAGANHYVECGSGITTDTLRGTSPATGTWAAQAGNPAGATLGSTTAGVAVVTLPVAPATGTWRFIYSANGCTDTMNLVLGVSPTPSIVINMGTNPICRNSTVQLCPTPWGWSNYQWYKNGVAVPAPDGTGSCITLDSTEVGSYTLAATNGAGCWSAQSAPIVVTYDNTCTGTGTGCNAGWYSQNATANCDSTLRFIASGSNAPGTTYTWTFGDGSTGTGATTTHKYATTGNFLVKLVVANGSCRDSVSYNITVSNCGVLPPTGVETQSIGDIIAKRMYGNAINNKPLVDGFSTTTKFTKTVSTAVNGPADLTLMDILPSSVANTDNAFISTPNDLLTFTNAIDALGVDYNKLGMRKAVAFGTKTLGDVYNHTKAVCDRLKGAELLEVKTIDVNGYNLLAYKIAHCTGEVEYAINLTAGAKANRATIGLQSNWFTDSYQKDEVMYNVQLWAVSYDMVTNMAKDVISKLQTQGTVQAIASTDLPKAYVSKGNRAGTKLSLTIQNNTAATVGYLEMKEKAAETNTDAQIVTKQIPVTLNAMGISTIEVDVKDAYEATINFMVNGSKTDMLYLNDGTWSLDYNKANTTINKFEVTNDLNATNVTNGEFKLLRNVEVQAVTKDFVSVYKTLPNNCGTVNLSNYKGIKFSSNAAGTVKITLVKKSITNWNEQYSYTLNLNEAKEYAIGTGNFVSSKYSSNLNMSDVVAVNFSFLNTRGSNSNVSASLSKVRFTTVDVAAQQALQSKQVSVYPNPVQANMFTTSFTSEV